MRFVKFTDESERAYDSCLPDYIEMVSLTNENSQYVYNGDSVVRLKNGTLPQIFETTNLANSKVKQFPFLGDPTRKVIKNAGILQTDSDIASDPVSVTGQTLNSLNIVYLTRYLINQVGKSTSLPLYSDLITLTGSSASYDLSSGLVSSYFLTASSTTDNVLYDLSGRNYHLSLRPVLGGTTHPAPSESSDTPVLNIIDDGSTDFGDSGTDTTVTLAAATSNFAGHKMTGDASPYGDRPFSISLTFKLTSSTTKQYILERAAREDSGSPPADIDLAREYVVNIDSAGTLTFALHSGPVSRRGITSSTVFSTGQWYNVILVYNGDETETIGEDCCKIYVNGVLETPSNSIDDPSPGSMNNGNPTVVPPVDSRLWIGAGGQNGSYSPDASDNFTGLLHSVHIWKNRQITATEANVIYEAELLGTAAGLIMHRNSSDNYNSLALKDRPLKNGTFRYGISNVNPEYSSVYCRHDHYGYFRDFLEPRKFFVTPDGLRPVKTKFMSGSDVLFDPTDTHAQNISVFATSSMPFIDDGVARNRSDNPDETLLAI